MAKRKKKSAKSKELSRVTRRIKEIEKRGYIVPSEFKEEIKGYSWQKLRTIKPQTIYKISHYVAPSGEMVSGIEGRKIEREIAGKLGAQTRKRKEVQEHYDDYPEMGELIYNQLVDLIDSYPLPGAEYLRKLLDYEIERYGKNAVMKSLATLSESQIRAIQNEIYYKGKSSSHHDTLKALADLIKGTIETEEEAKEIGQVQDALEEMY